MPITHVINSREIHLWCTFLHEVGDESLLQEYRKLLDDKERQQESRFCFTQDRCRYVVTRALVRTVLSRYVDVRPEKWTFASNRYGRPKISKADAAAQGLSFTVAHTNGLILLGIAHDHAIGVDAENVRQREAEPELADRFFTQDEITAIFTLPKDWQQRRLLEHWTLKESYVKARGAGSMPLDKFGFQFPREDRVNLAIHPEYNEVPDRWRFWQFSLSSDYLVAVCAERVRFDSPRLVLREVVPLVSERKLESTPLRVSENSVFH